MNKYIEFSNQSEVPLDAIKLLGVSDKRDNQDEMIGFFGTGWKYALAVLMRHDVPVTIYIGKKRIKVHTVRKSIGPKVYHVLCLDGYETSITTEMGIKWKLWYAIREVYANALDEGGSYEMTEKHNPKSGFTKVYIEINNALMTIINDWNKYFRVGAKSLSHGEYGKILDKTDEHMRIYKKGMLVHIDTGAYTAYDYELSQIDLGEDRKVESTYDIDREMSKVVAECSDVTILKKIFEPYLNKKKYYEFKCGYFGWNHVNQFHTAWIDYIDNRQLIPQELGGYFGHINDGLTLPGKLIKLLKAFFGDSIRLAADPDTTVIKADDKYDRNLMEMELKVLKKYGYSFNINNILLAEFKDKTIKGEYSKNKIYIAKSIYNPLHRRKLRAVLLEEIVHHDTQYKDETRQMQDYLIETILNIIDLSSQNELDLVQKLMTTVKPES